MEKQPTPTETTTTNRTSSASPPPNRKSKVRGIVIVTLLIAGMAAVFYYWQYMRPYESTDDAFIDSHVTPVAPQVPGRVLQLLVIDNQVVKRGDVLLEIDARDYEVRVTQARANLSAAQTRLAETKAQLAVDQAKADQKRAGLVAAEAEATRAQADLKRYQSVESRSISRSQLDLAEAQARSATAAVEVARNEAKAAEAQIGLSKANAETAAAGIQQAEAVLQQAELNRSYTKVSAPDDGFVTHRTVEPGAYVQTGQALLAIVPAKSWVVANFKETQLTYMRPGQPVEIDVDAYPRMKFKGHVDSIQRGSGARFSLLPPENASGNYIKVIQRVPVKIVFDEPPDPKLALGPGMSVVPTVRVR